MPRGSSRSGRQNSAFRDDEGLATTTYQAGMGSTGCDPNVLSVGAVSNGSCLDGRFDTIADFSQSGEALEILAPGECVVAAGGAKSGTSMAAPHVAGAVAVLASAREASSYEIWTALITTGPPITDPNCGIIRRRLDIPAAVTALLGSSGPLPTPDIAPKRGVAVSDPEIAPPRDVEPGERYALDPFLIRNTGSVAATFRLEVGVPSLLLAQPAPAAWVAVSPGSITLEPDELGFVFTDLEIPVGAAPGDYAALIAPIDDAALEAERGRSVLLTFTVGTVGSGGSGSSGGVGSGSGSTDDDLAWLDNPAILIGGGLVVLWLLWRLFRSPRRGT